MFFLRNRTVRWVTNIRSPQTDIVLALRILMGLALSNEKTINAFYLPAHMLSLCKYRSVQKLTTSHSSWQVAIASETQRYVLIRSTTLPKQQIWYNGRRNHWDKDWRMNGRILTCQRIGQFHNKASIKEYQLKSVIETEVVAPTLRRLAQNLQ